MENDRGRKPNVTINVALTRRNRRLSAPELYGTHKFQKMEDDSPLSSTGIRTPQSAKSNNQAATPTGLTPKLSGMSFGTLRRSISSGSKSDEKKKRRLSRTDSNDLGLHRSSGGRSSSPRRRQRSSSSENEGKSPESPQKRKKSYHGVSMPSFSLSGGKSEYFKSISNRTRRVSIAVARRHVDGFSSKSLIYDGTQRNSKSTSSILNGDSSFNRSRKLNKSIEFRRSLEGLSSMVTTSASLVLKDATEVRSLINSNKDESFTIELWLNTNINKDWQYVFDARPRGKWYLYKTGSTLNFVNTRSTKDGAGSPKNETHSPHTKSQMFLRSHKNLSFQFTEPHKWSHLAITYDSRSTCIYLNGNLQGSTSGPVNITHGLCFGTRYTMNQRFQGKIDEIRIWNKAKTRKEICNAMHLRVVGTEPNLIAGYRFHPRVKTKKIYNIVSEHSGLAIVGNKVKWSSPAALSLTTERLTSLKEDTGDTGEVEKIKNSSKK